MTSPAPAAAAHRHAPPCLRWDGKDFWDGLDDAFMMPSVSADEQFFIWEALSRHVRNRLLQRKGVRVPTLGSFDVVPEQIRAGDEVLTIQRPVFQLARNLAFTHHLTDDAAYLPGHKELEPLKYGKVAAAACKSRRKVEACVRGTTSLLSCCVGKGKGVALVLKDLGVLLIVGKRVEMKFYYDFLEALAGKESLEKAVSAAPWLLDAATSRIVPVASLSPAGNVVILPEFELELVTRLLSRDLLKNLLRIRAPVRSPPPVPARPAFPKDKRVRFREPGGRKTRQEASSGRRRSAMPKDPSAGKKSGSGRGRGKAAGKLGRGRGKAAGKLGRGRGYGGGRGGAGAENFLPPIPAGKKTKAERGRSRQSLPFLTTPLVAILSATSSEESLLGDPAPPPRPPTPPRRKALRLRPEKFWPVLE